MYYFPSLIDSGLSLLHFHLKYPFLYSQLSSIQAILDQSQEYDRQTAQITFILPLSEDVVDPLDELVQGIVHPAAPGRIHGRTLT